MVELSPKERVDRLFRREPLDTMPFFSGMGMVLRPALEALGYSFSQIHRDPEKLARSAIRSSKMFGFDSVVVPLDLCCESEALGNKINFYHNSLETIYPTIPEKIWRSMDEVEIPADITERWPISMIFEAIEICKKEAPEYPVGAWQLGPFTMAGQVLELNTLYRGVFKEPKKVAVVLDKLSEMIIAIGKKCQKAGADYITLREMGSGADLISPRTWKEMVQPRLTNIFASWKTPKILHICGSTDLIIEMMNDCGADALSVDIKNNLSASREKLGSDALIFGNFDVFKLPCKAETTVAEAVKAIKTNIDGGVDAVWPGCDLWPDIIAENMRAIVETTRTYGKKPSPAVGRL